MIIKYKPSFLKEYKKFSNDLKTKIRKRIELFRLNPHEPSLKVHPLKGKMSGFYSFSVNHSLRIVFLYEGKDVVVLLLIGGHEIYQ